jgi:hypothetical protein
MSKPKTIVSSDSEQMSGAIRTDSVGPNPPGPKAPDGPPPGNADIRTMPLDELKSRVEQAIFHAKQIPLLLPGGYVYTASERAHANGHVREGEEDIWLKIVQIAELHPQLFASLSDMDEGVDPDKLETDLMRDRVERAAILAPLVNVLNDMSKPNTSDTALHLRSLVRNPVREIYAIAKVVAKSHPDVKSLVAPIIDYYAKMAKAAQAAKAANDAARAAAAAAPATSTPK